jgi:predicted LPLAT superfamily acyltransferase
MREKILAQEWLARPERGSPKLLRLGIWTALKIGRPAARLFLYPVCLYFMLFSPAAIGSSSDYLGRVLGRPAKSLEILRHFLSFAGCILDRVYLLNEQCEQFDIRVHGDERVEEIEAEGGGCMLFGAHFGSFEVPRAIGRQRERQVSLLMYEENAKKIRAALSAINPRLATEVIGLGRLDSLILVSERLKAGHFIGVLADRNFDGKDMVRYPFLGGEAAFPRGPFRVAMLLQRPVVLMAGVYRGGNRYDVFFERLAVPPEDKRAGEAWLDATMRQYVARLEHYCREAPYNWFNFYDFWA